MKQKQKKSDFLFFVLIATMKKETLINKSDLFIFLDGYDFVNQDEIIMAICDYIEEQEGILFYSDSALAYDLALEYENSKK